MPVETAIRILMEEASNGKLDPKAVENLVVIVSDNPPQPKTSKVA